MTIRAKISKIAPKYIGGIHYGHDEITLSNGDICFSSDIARDDDTRPLQVGDFVEEDGVCLSGTRTFRLYGHAR